METSSEQKSPSRSVSDPTREPLTKSTSSAKSISSNNHGTPTSSRYLQGDCSLRDRIKRSLFFFLLFGRGVCQQFMKSDMQDFPYCFFVQFMGICKRRKRFYIITEFLPMGNLRRVSTLSLLSYCYLDCLTPFLFPSLTNQHNCPFST